eukprot:7338944-Ditylum_brightwellii.AAC.1
MHVPMEEVVVVGPSASGWVRRMLDTQELADAFDLPNKVPIPPGENLNAWATFLGNSVPAKLWVFMKDGKHWIK